MGMDFIDLEATARNSLGVGNDPEPQLKADPLLNFHGGVVGVWSPSLQSPSLQLPLV
jgi:hypothetical protein